MTEWRAVHEYEGYYEVSDDGQVRSLDRIVRNGFRKMLRRGILMTPRAQPNGYLVTSLRKNGHFRNGLIHRLVLIAFVGIPEKGMQACHNDGVKTNNHLDNLRWDTAKGNSADRSKHGTLRSGLSHPATKILETDVERARDLYVSGCSYTEVGKWLGFSRASARDILKLRGRFSKSNQIGAS